MQQFPSLIKYIPAQLWPVFGANFTAHRSECEHRKRIPLLSTVLDLLGEYPHLSSNACRSRLQWLPALSNTSSLRNGWIAGSLQYIFSLCNLLSSACHTSAVFKESFFQFRVNQGENGNLTGLYYLYKESCFLHAGISILPWLCTHTC